MTPEEVADAAENGDEVLSVVEEDDDVDAAADAAAGVVGAGGESGDEEESSYVVQAVFTLLKAMNASELRLVAGRVKDEVRCGCAHLLPGAATAAHTMCALQSWRPCRLASKSGSMCEIMGNKNLKVETSLDQP